MSNALLTGLFTLGGAGVGAIASYYGASVGVRRSERDDVREAARLVADEFSVGRLRLERAIKGHDQDIPETIESFSLKIVAWEQYKPLLARRLTRAGQWQRVQLAGESMSDLATVTTQKEVLTDVKGFAEHVQSVMVDIDDGVEALRSAVERSRTLIRRTITSDARP